MLGMLMGENEYENLTLVLLYDPLFIMYLLNYIYTFQ